MKTLGTLQREAAARRPVKAKDHPAYQYHLTNHCKLVRVAEQLKKFHSERRDEKKGK